MYACMHGSMQACMHLCIFNTSRYIGMYMYVCMDGCMHACMQACNCFAVRLSLKGIQIGVKWFLCGCPLNFARRVTPILAGRTQVGLESPHAVAWSPGWNSCSLLPPRHDMLGVWATVHQGEEPSGIAHSYS